MHTYDRSSPAQSFSALALEHDDCFAVRQAARHLSQLYERHLSAAGLTPTQFSILGALGATDPADPAQGQPSLTMAQLARTMVMERTTLVRALRPLLRSGLVADLAAAKHSATDGEHASQSADCRRRQVALTAAGRERLGEAGVHWRAAQDEFERRFGAQRAAWLRRELLRITRAV
ncbi:MarR family winged helix-turn-helix transcriptional regulator [Paraburkholderia sp. Ac-20347]|jgi:DNA-binding MarR family transcriptional regulator|uniref:MarR family winged helix-turn-helix transcriptional regulator n=1 Tax=Paraburkholderia sp. Ac-20347 TaxID=2703892 RepID=UPI001981507A|nr:MarR family winged helix-turn-helix transcriptional regulator [Paraburkholderia sp. Ac-20347]MBN3814144.1 winged helix-turn-helix transcriptional regulator [Paraburkholderia sp. Ac-20347]